MPLVIVMLVAVFVCVFIFVTSVNHLDSNYSSKKYRTEIVLLAIAFSLLINWLMAFVCTDYIYENKIMCDVYMSEVGNIQYVVYENKILPIPTVFGKTITTKKVFVKRRNNIRVWIWDMVEKESLEIEEIKETDEKI